MKILAIETSCDETAIAILDVEKKKKFKVLSHKIASQIKIHEQYGGVFPMMAKREHARNIVPLFIDALKESGIFEQVESHNLKVESKLRKLLEREQDIIEPFLKEIPKLKKPKIDRITVTVGPGLEPALWVGINFAKALSLTWNIPIVPVNHMEGHILSVFSNENNNALANNDEVVIKNEFFPAISLLVSGGHTELVLVKKIGKYKLIGQTVDDAAGEAFDKVARMLSLPYPGGPEISKLASESRNQKQKSETSIKLPRPMIGTKDFNFSFSGLKTAVLYLTRNLEKDKPGILQNSVIKAEIACEFENAVCDVLIKKTLKSAEKFKVKNIIVGGGVSANTELKNRFLNESPIPVIFPKKELSTDNAVMIGIAGIFGKRARINSKRLRAKGNMEI